jgi:hypothetical protein
MSAGVIDSRRTITYLPLSAAYSLPHDHVQSSEVPLSTSPNRSVMHYQLSDGLKEAARTVGPATACRSTG